ncbi:MAG: hypothetical protein DRO09_02490, partial [Thermoprotei archaeon]
ELVVGILPLRAVGSVYLVVSFKPWARPDVSTLESIIESAFEVAEVGKVVSEVLRATKGVSQLPRPKAQHVDCEVRLILVNAFAELPRLVGKPIRGKLGEVLREARSYEGISFTASIESIALSQYHPARRGDGGFKLVDLDEFNYVGMVKMDLDRFGDVRALYSGSLSRLVTLSNLVTNVINGKAYLHVFRELSRVGESGFYGVVVLYAGGDDVAVYGEWREVLRFAEEMYNYLHEALYPLTSTSAVDIDRYSYPILELYSRVAQLLGMGKEMGRGGVVILGRSPGYVCVGGGGCRKVLTRPVRRDTPGVSEDVVYSSWCLETLNRALNRVNELQSYLREIDVLARIGYESLSLDFEKPSLAPSARELEALVRLEIAYSYIWSRRGEKLGELAEKLLGRNHESVLPKYPIKEGGPPLTEALRSLINAKPLLDLIALAIRQERS